MTERGTVARADDDACVVYEQRGHVARVTLNRPHVLNAMNDATHERLGHVWDEIERNDDVWVAVLSGAGRAFCVGQDLKELAAKHDHGTAGVSTFGSRGRPGWPRLTERFSRSKPIVCKVHGYALGGGFELALASDVIVASEDAVFGLPEARLGLIPGAGGVFRLTRQLPWRVAMGYLITGRRFTARRAYDLGLINEVVDASNLEAAVDAWVDDILACAPLSVRAIKEAAESSAARSLEEAFTGSYGWEERRSRSADAVEGPRAFVQRRKPSWTGR